MNTSAIQKKSTLDIWNDAFRFRSPLAWILREQESKSWFRIYSLVGGKRYAENEQEKNDIIRRHNDVYDSLFEDQKDEILILLPIYKNKKFCRYKKKFILDLGFKKKFDYYENNLESFYDIYYNICQNKIENFDEIISLSADDKIMQPIFFNNKDVIFSCYDGGIDVFIFNLEKLEKFKSIFKNWLSDTPSGL